MWLDNQYFVDTGHFFFVEVGCFYSSLKPCFLFLSYFRYPFGLSDVLCSVALRCFGCWLHFFVLFVGIMSYPLAFSSRCLSTGYLFSKIGLWRLNNIMYPLYSYVKVNLASTTRCWNFGCWIFRTSSWLLLWVGTCLSQFTMCYIHSVKILFARRTLLDHVRAYEAVICTSDSRLHPKLVRWFPFFESVGVHRTKV